MSSSTKTHSQHNKTAQQTSADKNNGNGNESSWSKQMGNKMAGLHNTSSTCNDTRCKHQDSQENVEYLKNGSASSKHTDGQSTPKVVGEHRRSHSVIQSFSHWVLPSFLRSFVRSFIFSCMHTYIYDIQYKFICMYHIISC